MKASQLSQRRSAHQDGPGISLFPFLAVLICTMGALVPLLLAITRTARVQAEAAAAAKLVQLGAEVKIRHEDVQWRIKQLKESRAATESQLADARLVLGHLEDHSRRLRDQLAQYERTGSDLERLEYTDHGRLAQSQAELEQVRAQIQTAQQQLAQAHQSAASRTPSYAVVPYEGPNQTRRRPIYLECREDAVVLQPEGITFRESDFDGPLGPSNPLATALRAAREYMLSQRDFDPQAGEPYPMLLVRPEGISAYYAARAAMKSWGFDFGYELVGDDWKLSYPPPEPRLMELLRQLIATSRETQARLIAAAPRHYDTRPKAVYHASSGGGFAREDDADDDDATDYRPATPAGRVGASRGQGRGSASGGETAGDNGIVGSELASDSGRGNGTGSIGGSNVAGGDGIGGSPGGTGGSGFAGGGPVGGGNGVGSVGASNITGGNGLGGSPGATGGGGFADGIPAGGGNNAGGFGGADAGPALTATGNSGGSGPTGNGASGGPYGTPTGNPGSAIGNGGSLVNPSYSSAASTSATSATSGSSGSSGSSSNGAGGQSPEGYIVGQPTREQPAAAASARAVRPDDVQPAYALRPGEWEPTPEPMTKKPDDKQDDDKHADKHKKSGAEKRATDWALRNAAHASMAVTRPIRVECYADRLVLLSEHGPAENKSIPLGPRTQSSIKPLIAAVWECMDSWGMAGRGMYWRPVLQFYVAPDAEQRFIELSTLLEGSGLTVERK